MALPPLSKTWQYDVNFTQSGTATARAQQSMHQIKEALIGFATLPWTVAFSSDSVAAGTPGDGVDRWDATTDVVWAAGDHSWMVLKQTGISSNFQVCWDMGSDISDIELVISPSAGFTGGSISARPTATDEQIIVSDKAWGRGDATISTDQIPLHCMMSDDGQVTRMIFNRDSAVSGFISFEKAQNPVSGWTIPWFVIFSCEENSTPNESMTYARMRNDLASNAATTFIRAVMPNPTERFENMRMSSDGFATVATGTAFTGSNDISSDFEMNPASICCTVRPNRGVHGQIADIWFVSTDPAIGDTFPDDSSEQFAVFDNMAIPWNGTTPVVT